MFETNFLILAIECSIPKYLIINGVRRKFPRGGQVLSQSCDVTNQL